MTPNIHPHWKSTGSTGSTASVPVPVLPQSDSIPRGEGKSSSERAHRVPIVRSRLLLSWNILLACIGIAVLGFAFLKGVSRIRADLTAGLEPDLVIEVGDTGFSPPQASIGAGMLVEFRNTSAYPKMIRRDQGTDTSPFLTTTEEIPPGGTLRVRVPDTLVNAQATIRDPTLPTSILALDVVEAPEQEGGAAPIDGGATPSADTPLSYQALIRREPVQPQPEAPPEEDQGPRVEVPDLTTSQPTDTFPIQHIKPAVDPAVNEPSPVVAIPSSPEPPLAPESTVVSPSPVINIGDEVTLSPTVGGWPALLRINRFTVDRVPPPPPFAAIVSSAALAALPTSQPQHAAAPALPARITRQPATGPALGVVGLMSMSSALALWWRRRNRMDPTLLKI